MPVIKKNGEGDMVPMQARLELYWALDEAEADERAGDRGVTVRALRRQFKR